MSLRVIDGRFELLSKVPGSRSSQLYQATDLKTGERVAIKLISPLGKGGNEVLARRMHEFQILRNFSHPNALRVIQSGLTEGAEVYVATEWIDGQNLGDIVAERGPLSGFEATELLDQLASVLDAVHKAGMIHRGVKPRNIMIGKDLDGKRLCKLLGFDSVKVLAIEAGSSIKSTDVGNPGTPAFMSPEQALGRRVTKLSDVYATGVTIFAVLTGRLPFEDANEARVLAAHARSPIPSLAEKNPRHRIPASAEAVVRRAMAKEPSDRPFSVGEFARDFRAAIASAAAVAAMPAPEPIVHEWHSPPGPVLVAAPPASPLLWVVASAVSLGILGSVVALLAR